MKKLFLAVCATVIGAFSLNAQKIAFRAEVGGNVTNVSSKLDSKKFDTDMLMGLRAGAAVEFKFAPMVYAATGLNYRMGGSKATEDLSKELLKSKVTTTVRDHSLSLPVNLGLRVGLGSLSVSAEAGPYFAYTLSSKSISEITGELKGVTEKMKQTETIDLLKDNELRNRFEVGVGVSVAAEYKSFYLRLGTTWGLTNMMKENKNDVSKVANELLEGMPDTLKNHEFYLALGIRF